MVPHRRSMPSRSRHLRRIGGTSILLLVSVTWPAHAEKAIRFELEGKSTTLLPLDYSSQWIVGLKRNGALLQLKPHQFKNPQVVARFVPFSQAEARGELLREFGKKYEVTGTGNYLIVHPRGKRDLWAGRFEQLYRSMTHFFRARGYPMKKPRFPMVGVVFHSENHYQQYGQRALKTNVQGTCGVYLPTTNRIYLYDATAGSGTKSDEWAENLATIMHESAHQTAFNTGIHRRGAEDPRWIVEGLGCLFEAPGIYNALHHGALADRINFGRLAAYRQSVQNRATDELASIVASDDLFRRAPGRAYAAAWALTFYLSEREPRKTMRYLKQVAQRKDFARYSEAERVADFVAAFGEDFRMLAARINRFLESLPAPSDGSQS